MQRIDNYKMHPPLYVAHYRNVVRPMLGSAGNAGTRDAREVESLSEAMDAVIDGEPLRALMILLGRRKAVFAARTSEGGWGVARYHEVLPDGATVLTARDRENASKDARMQQSLDAHLGTRGRSCERNGGGPRRSVSARPDAS